MKEKAAKTLNREAKVTGKYLPILGGNCRWRQQIALKCW
jgi:hypothetical protein